MHLTLLRTYYEKGTNGILLLDDKPFCFTIELPWLNNRHQISCIPEGTYTLSPRNYGKFKQHLLVNDVPDRDLILIHPANNALLELQGCIAPVSELTGPGCGNASKAVFRPLVQQVTAALQQHSVTITIKKNDKQ